MRASPDIPLSDDEIEELDRFLIDELDTIDISTLDGFFTALLCGPRTIMPDEWMPWIWDPENGKEPPDFKDEREARRIMDLLTRHMNDIASTLYTAPEAYQPLLMEYFDDEKKASALSLHEWSWGFMMGIDLDREGWQPLFDRHSEWTHILFEVLDLRDDPDARDEEMLVTDAPRDPVASGEARAEISTGEQRDEVTLEEQREQAAELTVAVQKIYAWWLERRGGDAKAGATSRIIKREPIRNPGKVGRNDPCPCGSGRKFKQCHGAAGATIH